jgi:hypothetical protein
MALLIGMGDADAPQGRRAQGVTAFSGGCAFALWVLIETGGSAGCTADDWFGHVARHMAQRAAFNAIDIWTWATGLVQPIPFIGRIVGFVAPQASVTNLGNYVPGTYL